MQDFDSERHARHVLREAEFGEKPFKFGGEIFYVKANVRYPAIKKVAEISEASSGIEVFEAVENAVIAMIDSRDDAYTRFHAVCQSDVDPITFDDLIELQNWLIGETTGRPPTQQNSSASGPSTVGTSLTASSSTETGAA